MRIVDSSGGNLVFKGDGTLQSPEVPGSGEQRRGGGNGSETCFKWFWLGGSCDGWSMLFIDYIGG